MRKPEKWYTVYDNKTDFPVIVDGHARECAVAMGVSYASFRQIASKYRHGTNGRWSFVFEEDLED